MFGKSSNRGGGGGDNGPDDFKALLGRTEKAAASPAGTNTQPFDLDHVVTQQKKSGAGGDNSTTSPTNQFVHMSKPSSTASKTSSIGLGSAGASLLQWISSLCDRLSAYISMLCFFYPCLCGSLVFLCIGVVLWGLGQLIFNPVVEYGVVKHHISGGAGHDHSFLESQYNAKLGQIDHWCLRGDNKSCQCEDPLQPTSRADRKSWRLAFKANRKTVKALQESQVDLDLVFLGESIVEEMDGRWMGQSRSPTLQKMSAIFHKRFDKTAKDSTAQLNAVALGIAGDTAPNVLWRLMHGEMTPQFNPKIWWLSLGMNDLARMQCSEEVVVLGILRVVEEILKSKPNVHVVINSLFPMSRIRGSLYPHVSDYQDSFPTASGSSRVRPARTADVSLQVPRPLPSTNTHGGGRQRHRRQLIERVSLDRELRHRKKFDKETPRQPLSEAEAANAEDARIEKEEAKRNRGPRGWLFGRRRPGNAAANAKVRKRDIILQEQHQVRKHIRDTKLPLWTSVVAINNELRNFAATTDRVTFFDVTKIFTTRDDNGVNMIRTDLISIRGHPSHSGFDAWEDAVATEALLILADLRSKSSDGSGTSGSVSSLGGGGKGDILQEVLNFENFPTDDDFEDAAFFSYNDQIPSMPEKKKSVPSPNGSGSN